MHVGHYNKNTDDDDDFSFIYLSVIIELAYTRHTHTVVTGTLAAIASYVPGMHV